METGSSSHVVHGGRIAVDERSAVSKTQRQHRIVKILEEQAVPSGAQLVTLLDSEGISATQATVTRDLQELGVVKSRDSQGVRRLTLPSTPTLGPAPLDHLRRMMGEWAVGVESAGHLVVVRTPPGCAHVVASALDRSALSGVLGTVAGDDTILVIATESKGGTALANDLRSLAGLTALETTNKKSRS
jgi:transcriptional regulator of arginine metabolism